MRKAENRAVTEGKVLADNAKPMMSSEITFMESKNGIPPRPVNMLVPILVMVFIMPVMLIYTGWDGVENHEGKTFFAISPYDENIIYACLQNGTWSADIGEVFKSVDGGDSWEAQAYGDAIPELWGVSFVKSGFCNPNR